jgi:hypothetical protein
VKNSKGGEIQFEVPWREGTAIRSARRADLVLLLTPLIKAPKVDVLAGQIQFSSGGGVPTMSFDIQAYIVPREQVCFPVHTCTAEILSGNIVVADSFRIILDSPTASFDREQKLRSIGHGNFSNELLLSVPEKISVKGLTGPATRFTGQDDLQLRVTFIEAFSETPVFLFGNFRRIKDEQSVNQPNRWALVKN